MSTATEPSPIQPSPSEPTAAPAARLSGIDVALAATALISAWLIFQVQPMVAKRILPWFGGGTAVWTTVMLFFQTALFLGYLYAHLTTRRLSPARQVHFHVALLATAAMLATIVGVLPTDGWRPTEPDLPALHILVMLAAGVGLPYLALAATAPLTQVWFARVHPGRSPYRLYALSNAGSLGALLSYPLLIEPNLGVVRQGIAWSALFVVFALMCAWSGLASLRRGAGDVSGAVLAAGVGGSIRPLQRFFWIALPATASVALLAITNHLCQDVLSVPLLWIAPVVVYLLSFILTFDSDRWYRREVWLPLGAVAAFAAAGTFHLAHAVTFAMAVTINLALLLTICMICHGEVVRLRPPADRLTGFYLSIAAGGALGGVIAGVIAPLVLNDFYEYQIVIFAAWALALATMVTDPTSRFYDGGKGASFAGLLGMAALMLILAMVTWQNLKQPNINVLEQSRNFYGALRVSQVREGAEDEYLELTNGRIAHGSQFQRGEVRRVPMWYYAANTAVGQALIDNPSTAPRRVGVIGLGAGALAAYAEADDVFRFYEINADVLRIADQHFTFLEEARQRGAAIELVEGDARISLENEPEQNFDILVLDAFNGDSIPAHLLTTEAFELYLKHLKEPDGLLAVHVSSIHLMIPAVLKSVADRFGLHGILVATASDNTPASRNSVWVLLSREPIAIEEGGLPLEDATKDWPAVEWTDDYSSLLDVLIQ